MTPQESEMYQRWLRLAQDHGWATNAHLAAIEAEAVAAERARIRAAVEGKVPPDSDIYSFYLTAELVLRIIDGKADA